MLCVKPTDFFKKLLRILFQWENRKHTVYAISGWLRPLASSVCLSEELRKREKVGDEVCRDGRAVSQGWVEEAEAKPLKVWRGWMKNSRTLTFRRSVMVDLKHHFLPGCLLLKMARPVIWYRNLHCLGILFLLVWTWVDFWKSDYITQIIYNWSCFRC